MKVVVRPKRFVVKRGKGGFAYLGNEKNYKKKKIEEKADTVGKAEAAAMALCFLFFKIKISLNLL